MRPSVLCIYAIYRQLALRASPSYEPPSLYLSGVLFALRLVPVYFIKHPVSCYIYYQEHINVPLCAPVIVIQYVPSGIV